MKNPKEEKCTCKEHDPYCCQIHGNCPTCVKKEEFKQENCCTPLGQIKRYEDCYGCDRKPKQEQEVCNHCSKTLREQMKGCGKITCYRQFSTKQEKLTYTESSKKEERISNCTMMKRKQETLDEAAERISPTPNNPYIMGIDIVNSMKREAFKEGAKWQQERMYSEKEVESLLHKYMQSQIPDWHGWSTTKWFEQFKKK